MRERCPLYPNSGHLQCTSHVRYIPKADIARLFDHLVGTREQRGRNREAERLGGLKVDHEFKSGWLFYWEGQRACCPLVSCQ